MWFGKANSSDSLKIEWVDEHAPQSQVYYKPDKVDRLLEIDSKEPSTIKETLFPSLVGSERKETHNFAHLVFHFQ